MADGGAPSGHSERQNVPSDPSCSGTSSGSSSNNNSNNKVDGSGRPPSVKRKFRTLTFGRRYKTKCGTGGGGSSSSPSGKDVPKKRKGPWNFKFSYRLRRGPAPDIPEPNVGCDTCVCTGYRRTEEHHLGAGIVFRASQASASPSPRSIPVVPDVAGDRFEAEHRPPGPIIDLSKFNPDDYPIEDWEERARAERARELEEGVDPPPGYHLTSPAASLMRHAANSHQLLAVFDMKLMDLAASLQSRLAMNPRYVPQPLDVGSGPSCACLSSKTHLVGQFDRVTAQGACLQRTVHTQVDYIHCLVPDLHEITKCSFYWGKMDRYEAERLLDTKPEGTFLLRDSAQEEYLFSVSFRRYGRSLHARIEQWNHKFSFDSHDPGVFASGTVCGLIEHYKDPSCCLFFEPMLTIPLHRTFPFPLQHLCRAVICKASTYDGVNALWLPKTLKAYLKEYHYKQRVRVRMFEVEH